MALILGLESSCDETAAAVVKDGHEVLSNAVATQMRKHAAYGGVVPELAAREHLKAFDHVLSEALNTAQVNLKDIDAVAVTQGPGLIPALLVGLNYAKGLAAANNLPLLGMNHFIAHIYASFLDSPPEDLKNPATYPILALVVSGGHSSLIMIAGDGTATQIGATIDDAAGEALDKAAKLLNLGYPGGPVIEKTAAHGDPAKYNFPRPLTGGSGKPLAPELKFSFSFSGIKTALLYHVQKLEKEQGKLEEKQLFDTVASFQEAVIDVLVKKTVKAAREFKAKTVVLCGGVACNSALRSRLKGALPQSSVFRVAPPKYCTDNAAMVAGLGYHNFIAKDFAALDIDSFARLPRITRVPFCNAGANNND